MANSKLSRAFHHFRTMSAKPRLSSLVALVCLCLLAILTSPHARDGSLIFLQPGNLTDILRQLVIVGILALAMTYVILTGGIDLSVGSTLALSTVIVASAVSSGIPGLPEWLQMPAAIAGALVVSLAVGAANGVVVAALRVQPFIATLATMIGARGLAKWYSSNENIDIGFGDDRAARFADLFAGKSVVIGSYLLLTAVFAAVLAKTVFGRHMRAIGDNPLAATYAGLAVRKTQIWVYLISGLAAGMAGILYAAENRQGNPNAGVAYELDAIAAVVIGGTRLSGGSGTIVGTVIGTLIMGILTNLLRLNNVDSNVEMMIKATLIVLAAAAQRRK